MEFFTGLGIVIAVFAAMLLFPRVTTVLLSVIVLDLTKPGYLKESDTLITVMFFMAIIAFFLDGLALRTIKNDLI